MHTKLHNAYKINVCIYKLPSEHSLLIWEGDPALAIHLPIPPQPIVHRTVRSCEAPHSVALMLAELPLVHTSVAVD